MQTILPILLPTPLVEFDREYILMKDKGVVALDWFVRIRSSKRKRLVFLVVIPGMTDNTLDVANVCKLGAKKGFRPLVFNFRGHGKTVLTTPKLQSYGDPSDLRQIIKYIKERYPRGLISVVGYGTGCDLVLSYLGEYGSSASISGAVCISPCYDVTDRFTKTVDRMYDFFYMLRLKNILCCHSKSLSKNIDLSRAIQTWSFQEYYQSVYSKLYGFSDMDEFWDRNNPLRDVDDISVPVLFINSLDDPFYSKNEIPYDLCQYYPNFFIVSTDIGGHCGFIDEFPYHSWSDQLSVDYVDAIAGFSSKRAVVKNTKRPRSTI